MKIFFLYYEVRPAPGADTFHALGGAFVSCWVKALDQFSAERTASEDIVERGFEATSLLEARPVSRGDYEPELGWRDYLERADEEGASFLYNAWPAEPQEGDVIH